MWNLSLITTVVLIGLAWSFQSIELLIAGITFGVIWSCLALYELKKMGTFSNVDWRTVWKMLIVSTVIGIAIWAHWK